jgi:hypothetical protein
MWLRFESTSGNTCAFTLSAHSINSGTGHRSAPVPARRGSNGKVPRYIEEAERGHLPHCNNTHRRAHRAEIAPVDLPSDVPTTYGRLHEGMSRPTTTKIYLVIPT